MTCQMSTVATATTTTNAAARIRITLTARADARPIITAAALKKTAKAVIIMMQASAPAARNVPVTNKRPWQNTKQSF